MRKNIIFAVKKEEEIKFCHWYAHFFFVESEGLLQRMMHTSIGGEKNPFYFSVIIQLSSIFSLLTGCFKAMLPNIRLFSSPGSRVRNWKTVPFYERLKCWCLMTPNSICGDPFLRQDAFLRPSLHSPTGRGVFGSSKPLVHIWKRDQHPPPKVTSQALRQISSRSCEVGRIVLFIMPAVLPHTPFPSLGKVTFTQNIHICM